MMQEVEVLKTIQELICSFFSEEQFTLSLSFLYLTNKSNMYKMKRSRNYRLLCRISTSVVYQLPKLRRRVRFPYPA